MYECLFRQTSRLVVLQTVSENNFDLWSTRSSACTLDKMFVLRPQDKQQAAMFVQRRASTAPTTTKDLTLLGRTRHHLDLNELSELFVNGTELSKSVACLKHI